VNQNLRTFIAIFFFIWGVVGAVLAFANLTQEPSSTSGGAIFAIIGLIGFIAGWLMVKKPSY
jgi:uncharacterized membrane protein HdeD (DUF308 family)